MAEGRTAELIYEHGVRYGTARREISNLNGQDGMILEVGPDQTGVGQFLESDEDVVYLDAQESHGYGEEAHRVMGDVLKLPFEDDSAKAVVGLDLIEHLEKGDRWRAVEEMYRVVQPGGIMIVGSPVGKEAQRADEWFYDEYREIYGSLHPWTEEHLTYGLPEEEDYEKWVSFLTPEARSHRRIPDVTIKDWKRYRKATDLRLEQSRASVKARLLGVAAVRLMNFVNNDHPYRMLHVVEKGNWAIAED